jgi:hypothetical protein
MAIPFKTITIQGEQNVISGAGYFSGWVEVFNSYKPFAILM